MKRVFIIHGWGGHPNECWFPWLKRELEKKEFVVHVPQMPNTDYPKIEEWVPFLANVVGTTDKDTYFVGHSIGCQTIFRYLQNSTGHVGGVVCVGGWLTLTGLETEQDKEMARPWLETPIDFVKVKQAAKKITAIFSDNDPYVPLENEKLFSQHLGAKTVVVKNKGHIGASDNCPQLPEALNAVLEISR